VAFVDEHQVVALEGVHGDRLLLALLGQLVDVDDLDGASGEQARRVLVEEVGLHPRQRELAQMLP